MTTTTAATNHQNDEGTVAAVAMWRTAVTVAPATPAPAHRETFLSGLPVIAFAVAALLWATLLGVWLGWS